MSYDNLTIDTYGLSDNQIDIIRKNVPTKNCEVLSTDCFTDIVAIGGGMAVVVVWSELSDDDKNLLCAFYSDIAPFSETLILIGDVDIADNLRKQVLMYESFEDFATNAKYILLSAYKRAKKNENFSKTLANTIIILSQIRNKPFVTTKELAGKLELSERTVQRYIETLRVAGEWIEYDVAHKGWTLTAGKSILWGDI